MNRRDFLTAKRKSAQKTPDSISQTARTQSGLTPYTGAFGTEEVVHLLKRTMFGATAEDVTYFKTRSVTQAIDELLNPTAALPAPPVKDYNETGTTTPDTTVAPGTTWVNTYNTDGTISSRRRSSFKKWSIGIMINQDRSIREKMTLFWHNHFATETAEIIDPMILYRHHALLRADALGDFKKMVRDVTLDAGMLRYLNGYLNTATAPDENYARELQELFTVGKENNPNYTEDDVKAAARVLTGWRIDYPNSTGYYDNNRHDKNNKQFSSYYSNTVITGRNGATAGEQELDDLLNMIFAKREDVSRFIVKKIYRWFCYYTIDAAANTNVIEPLAQLLRDNNWNIKVVLDTLLKSEHFFDPLNRGCLIKSPLELGIALCREFDVKFPNAATEYVDAYNMWDYIRAQVATFNQDFADPPSVSGWPAYYQEPQFYELWINSDTLPKRNRFTDIMVTTGYTRSGKNIKIDPIAFAKKMSNPGDPNILITDSLAILYRVPLSQTSRDTIKKNILLSGQDQDYYWTNAWNAYIANPTDTMALQTVNTRLRDLYKYFMNLAEYQLA
ncbi:MAG: DUF1800 domain-containing protein [Sphingobacteriales bacterium]|nr:MAG: DUF1800 domain-containing protein [Sphingobacteriales bacterium]